MHTIAIPQSVVERVTARRGRAHPYADFDPRRTALVVIDMQNGFMMPEVAHALCVHAPAIVPNINRLAAALRAAGGKVFWIQNTHDEACFSEWSVMYDLLLPERRAKRVAAMTEGSLGHRLWAGLDVQPEDEVVAKYRYSAFIQGSSDLAERLRAQNLDTVLITGTVTNTCCESSARDAMMLNFKTIMVTDANAANNDEEHNASLIGFYLNFGDIMSTDELVAAMKVR
ncbi:cysteine hydrolase family protein [Chelatococcus asaccharovorans]|uniref:isochorismatase family cysteine hydrolase n=1 Tax=Chelatococcus asaccharovorans TaxID=28210 RepID=UPI00224C64D9|nr:isochorismatase family cysteine hydrolase [Chelatococcus asaccharovorans]CAH1649561.1 Nicotinamidase/isochorismatase family protein [Chelatococcus asaccharovorans]CAH1691661.1 Nicotinamidase/isochorismatase family protein [Chelatococcus asaccharovorans]